MSTSLPRLWYSEGFELSWEGHVFPAGKYRALQARLLAAGLARAGDFGQPEPLGREELLLGHSAEYLDRLEAMTADPAEGWLEFEAPCSTGVLEAFFLMAGGTLAAAESAARQGGFAANLGGGFHHAFPHKGEGFCAVNDIVIAVRWLQKEGLARRIAVVDLDVHQGNGTAWSLAGDPGCFTLSLHQENNYPVKQQSSLDLGLPDHCGDGEYLLALERGLGEVERFDPDFVIYVAGADPYVGDRLGGLDLSLDGLLARDRMVFEASLERGRPTMACLAGGYAEAEEEVVEIHFRMIRAGLVSLGKEI